MLCYNKVIQLYVRLCACWVTSVVSDSVMLWIIALEAPLSMGFSRPECWSGSPFPSPGDLPDPGIKAVPSMSCALAGGSFNTSATCETQLCVCVCTHMCVYMYTHTRIIYTCIIYTSCKSSLEGLHDFQLEVQEIYALICFPAWQSSLWKLWGSNPNFSDSNNSSIKLWST